MLRILGPLLLQAVIKTLFDFISKVIIKLKCRLTAINGEFGKVTFQVFFIIGAIFSDNGLTLKLSALAFASVLIQFELRPTLL